MRSLRASLRIGIPLALTAIFGMACDFECTEIGCERTGLLVSASRLDGDPLAQGNYEIWIAADGGEYRAECSLEALEAQSCAFRSVDVSAPQELFHMPELSVAGDDMPRDIRIELSHFEDTAQAYKLTGPQDLAIEIKLDGKSLLASSHQPRYERDEPNGPGCGACEYTQLDLDLLGS